MTATKTRPESKCGTCGATGVRLYRPFGFFRYPEDDRCNGCRPPLTKSTDEYLPCVFDKNGFVWGSSNIDADDWQAFLALPDAKPDGPALERFGWSDCPFAQRMRQCRRIYLLRREQKRQNGSATT